MSRPDYRRLDSFTDKVRYLTNVNGARNECIADGQYRTDWVFPLDGGTFLRKDGWNEVRASLSLQKNAGFFGVHTWRAKSYADALENSAPDMHEEYRLHDKPVRSMRELSLGFSRRADAQFDTQRFYGNVDKAELLWRLGIKGFWDMWEPHLQKASLMKPSKFFGKVPIQGSVCRLPSGIGGLDGNNLERGHARAEGLRRLIAVMDNLKG